ncbi:TPA: hypothetical protein HA246_04385 [Candidatus Woesearchaeota archaeon]|nr:hypothetical protein [Candidatus Woesearchaeota archaeon]
MTSKTRTYFAYAVIIILCVLVIWQFSYNQQLAKMYSKAYYKSADIQKLSGIGDLGSQHIHAHLTVMADNKKVDFAKPNYQLQHSFIHFEDGEGHTVHVHATGLTLGNLFKSLGGEVNLNCMKIESKEYCSSVEATGNKLKVYVNGERIFNPANYLFKNMDRILVAYGTLSEDEIKKELENIGKIEIEE